MTVSNPAEMTGYASLYPGVDHLPTAMPRIDRYGHAWCWCGVKNGQAVAGDGQCDECRNRPKPKHAHITYGHGCVVWECARCSQSMVAHIAGSGAQVPARVCWECQQQGRAPQGEAMRLFAPAPTQLEGQMTF